MQKNISDRIRNSKKCHALRQDLLEQLRAAGLDTAVNRDLVEDYVSLWIIKQWVMIDIRTRGPVITYNNGSTAVAVGGSLSHPNNRGMEQIAGRIIDMLKL